MDDAMKTESIEHDELKILPLTVRSWEQFLALFGMKGACGNCWCMYYRLGKQEFIAGKKNNVNKDRMHDLVLSGKPAGLLGLIGNKPVAWCAFAPREDFEKLSRSRVHKPIDDRPVWSIPCLFVAKEFRRQGVSVAFLKAVVEFAGKQQIQVVEAYPTIPTTESLPDSFAWIGLYSAFEKAGFVIVDRTSKSRPMVRYYCNVEKNKK
jgi:GNAT superfamily N-acetyltransferase